jgi:hypothetical protein
MKNSCPAANRMFAPFSSYFSNTPQSLSELLYTPLPHLPTAAQKAESILIGTGESNKILLADIEDVSSVGGKWEDEEERRFYEDIPDLADFVPKSVLGLEGEDATAQPSEKSSESKSKPNQAEVDEEVQKLQEELEKLNAVSESAATSVVQTEENDEESEYESFFSAIYCNSLPELALRPPKRRRRRRAVHQHHLNWRPKARLKCLQRC